MLCRITIITLSCVVGTVPAQCPEDRDAAVMNGHDLKKYFIAVSLPIEPRLRRNLAARVGSLSCHGRISVGSHSAESGRCRNRLGAF